MNEKIKKVDAQTFIENYAFLEGYDDIVTCNDTGLVYKSNYINGFVQLVEVSNMSAMEKIEKGIANFKKNMIDQGFGQ